MSKKKDLMLVFDFIAEYLKEESVNTTPKVTTKELLVEGTKSMDDVLVKLKQPIDNLGKDAKYIKDLMDRVDAKSIDQAVTNNLLTNQKREFDKEIQKLKDDFNDKLKSEKQTENDIVLSGSPVTMISQDNVDNIITEDKANTKGQSTRYKAANFEYKG
jgi:hypothetical protein